VPSKVILFIGIKVMTDEPHRDPLLNTQVSLDGLAVRSLALETILLLLVVLLQFAAHLKELGLFTLLQLSSSGCGGGEGCGGGGKGQEEEHQTLLSTETHRLNRRNSI